MSDVQALIEDGRSKGERAAWKMLGPPIYYCSACLRKVKIANGDPVRSCGHEDYQVIAPRTAILAGEGGLNAQNKIKAGLAQVLSTVFGRTFGV